VRKLLIIALCIGATKVWAVELPPEFQGKWGNGNQECKQSPLVLTAKPATEESNNFGHEQEILSVKTAKSSQPETTLLITVRSATTKNFYTYREAWAIRHIRDHTFLLQTYLGEVPPLKDDAPTISVLQAAMNDRHWGSISPTSINGPTDVARNLVAPSMPTSTQLVIIGRSSLPISAAPSSSGTNAWRPWVIQ
jgi:hypothetical protein